MENGKPVLGDDGRPLTAPVQPSAALGQYEPYVHNASTGGYRWARHRPRHVDAWLTRDPD
ncbi:hypothetical protein [Kineosporia babensis]|uniref:Uncharacterized protein n=1 Tax=Kineosporia babensis TaxID=499548 RepID=A0A9X1N9I9_9ACTN|nr:hypothetical protein [Kineosporia babensis]MCD5310867.1 hypothetical protein [Kineosporia babensis]